MRPDTAARSVVRIRVYLRSMSDASAPPSPDRQPDQAPDTDAAHAAEKDPNAGPPLRADHHGLVAFLGVVALILLLVGAVGAAGMTGRSILAESASIQIKKLKLR